MKTTRVVAVEVKVDLAKCLWPVAWLILILFSERHGGGWLRPSPRANLSESWPSFYLLPRLIPLTDDQLILMGRIAVLWGQIDEGFNSIVRWILNLPSAVFDSLLADKMIGARVNHLRVSISLAKDRKNRELLDELVKQLTLVLPARNAAMHGCWGRYVADPTYSKTRVGIYNHQKPKTRFYVRDLPGLYQRLVEIMHIIAELQMRGTEANPPATLHKNQKVYFAPQPPDERATEVSFERGDRVVRVESGSPRWRKAKSTLPRDPDRETQR